MKKYKFMYKDIIENKITDSDLIHPLSNRLLRPKNKSFFVEYLLKDLGIKKENFISNKEKNLFNFFDDENFDYNLFIENPDGGGKDITENKTDKKISIPFDKATFKKLIENYEKVLVINIYFPLKKNREIDDENRIYLIVKPSEIYESKVIKKKTWNASSRWAKLEDILSVIIDKNIEYKENKRKNVYILSKYNLKQFFYKNLKKEYDSMIQKELDESANQLESQNQILDPESEDFQKYRKIFRQNIIWQRGNKCEIKGCKVNVLQLMIASHIKPVNKIIKDKNLDSIEKKKQISDPENGFLLCPNHDSLFDKFFITFDKEGKLKSSKIVIDRISEFNLFEGKKVINVNSEEMIDYLKFHEKEFYKKESDWNNKK